MFLQSLALTDYRNYERLELETGNRVNLIIGPNAQGKTNLLEAIYVMSLTKSHRTHKDRELIRWNAERASLRAQLDKKYGAVSLDLSIASSGKTAKINGLEQRKLSAYIGALNVVLFAPEDLDIVKGAPNIRRRFLDMEIGQIQPTYLHHLSQYQKTLVQRNNFLKQSSGSLSSASKTMLEVWDEQLANFGIKIMKKRQNFIKKLQIWAESLHRGITNGQEQLDIVYQPAIEIEESEEESVLFERFMLKLSHMREQDLRRGTTQTGPHRDDIHFYINGKEAHVFGSQGQQRTTALSLKLAEIELIHEEVGEYPLLLLDDVLSELDQYRQTQLIETFQTKVQTFITSTGVEAIDFAKLEDVGTYRVTEGNVTRS
ncbi:DNA replication/repair protein RecF [Paenibacillus turpanensis]|uniref:DNA replication/repair protein RecF n=1 Tax=Paenibacillus turpanensis TaxID=2689078 RepID=UPI00140B4402|nr:DNA replication/repair protein RecF [Paenibacillus turpanensis]